MVEKIITNYSNRTIKRLDKKKVQFENSQITKIYYSKMKACHSGIMILCMITIFCSFSIFDFSYDSNHLFSNPEENEKRHLQKNILLIYSSFSAISLIILEIFGMKYELLYKRFKGSSIKDTEMLKYKNLKKILINSFFYLMHPNYIVENLSIINENNIVITFYLKNKGKYIDYTLNDVLLLLNLLNAVPFFNSMLKYIEYNSDVADRAWLFKK